MHITEQSLIDTCDHCIGSSDVLCPLMTF